MEFLNPLYLIGIASAAIPLIIHLSRSRRTKKLRFSTTRFLTDQFLQSYRMSRLKELLLLAARMALCALFAMALAQPFVRPGQGGLLISQSRRTVVLVIDNSASMGYRENDQTLFDRARHGALEILNGLQEGDRVALVFAGRRELGPEIPFPEPTPEFGDVRQTIDALTVSHLGTDLSTAVKHAEQLVQSSGSESSQEVYVFSDLQKTGWELADNQQRDTTAGVDIHFFFVSVRPQSPRNLAVTAVQYGAARPMVGIPFVIQPHIRNQGDTVRDCDVSLFVDGKKVAEQHLASLQAGRWAVPTFHHTFNSGGWHRGHVEINDSTLQADDRRHFSFEVLDTVNVLAVNGAPSSVPRLDELFFLQAALSASSSEQSPINISTAPPAGLENVDLAAHKLVVLANVESLAAPALTNIEEYVDKGGSLLVFLGDQTNAAYYNRALVGSNRLHGGLLPGKLTGIEGDPATQVATAEIGDFDGNHVVLSTFDNQEGGSLASVTLRAFWKIDAGAANILMHTSTGAPLLCERSFGQGKVVVFSSSCDRDWTNFPVRPAYLPWLYRLVGYLAQEPLARQNFYETGARFEVAVAATTGAAPWLIKKPDGSTGNLRIRQGTPPRQSFDDTAQPGIYTVFLPGQEAAGQDFVANLEAYESDLQLLDDVLVEQDASGAQRRVQMENHLRGKLLPGRTLVSFISTPDRIAEESLTARRGLQLWDIVLLLALAVALFEPWFANHISLLRYFKARKTTTSSRAVPGAARAPARTARPAIATTQPTDSESTPRHPEPAGTQPGSG